MMGTNIYSDCKPMNTIGWGAHNNARGYAGNGGIGSGSPTWAAPPSAPPFLPHLQPTSTWLDPLDSPNNQDTNLGMSTSSMDQALLLHPLYPKLVSSLCSCRQALAATSAEASRLEDASRRALAARQEAIQSSLARGFSMDGKAQDPDLQEFMEQYIIVLEQYRSELASIMQEMDHLGKDFDCNIAQLLQAAVNGADLQETSTQDTQTETSASKRPALDSMEDAHDSWPGAASSSSPDAVEDAAVKDALKKKYAEKLQELQHEFSRKKRKGKLPSDAVEVLKTWWQDNVNWPYPSEDVKRSLIDQTGLDLTQLNNWFINQRKRHWNGRAAEEGHGGRLPA